MKTMLYFHFKLKHYILYNYIYLKYDSIPFTKTHNFFVNSGTTLNKSSTKP